MKDLLLTALKTKRLGRLCKVGAWSILGIGILQAALNIVYAWNEYRQIQVQLAAENGQNITFGQNTIFGPSPFTLFSNLAGACQGVILPIFLFVVLYIGGTIFSTLAASTAPTRDDTEDIVYESLQETVKVRM
ncbi:MAG: hypothetical protein ABI234_16650 [Ktedonobacteraceae bacterium]